MFESYIRGVFYYNYSSCHQLHTVALSFLLIKSLSVFCKIIFRYYAYLKVILMLNQFITPSAANLLIVKLRKDAKYVIIKIQSASAQAQISPK